MLQQDVKDRIVFICQQLCAEQSGIPVYITLFGSRLYGTYSETSDIDVKCIFFPLTSIEQLSEQCIVAGQYQDSIQVKCTKNWERTTNHEDTYYEIECWSLQKWLLMLKAGDTGAVDLVYSYSSPKTVIYNNGILNGIFENPLQCFNPKYSRAFLGFAVKQSEQYSIKGVRLQLLLNIRKQLDIYAYRDTDKLEQYIDSLLAVCAHDMFFSLASQKHGEYRVVRLLGSEHQGGILMSEFLDRIDTYISEYGERARHAAETGGKDWKALSHALRVIEEFIEILTTGTLYFPLQCVNVIRSIKHGEKDLEEVRNLLETRMMCADQLRQTTSVIGYYNKKFIDPIIIHGYQSLVQKL